LIFARLLDGLGIPTHGLENDVQTELKNGIKISRL